MGAAEFTLYRDTINNYRQGPNANRNMEIQTVTRCLERGTCPMPLRLFKEAQHSYQGQQLQQPDPQNVRIKVITGLTTGLVFSLAMRIVRTVTRTVFLPVNMLHCWQQGSRLNLPSNTSKPFWRAADEWLDLAVNVLCIPIGVVKIVKPDVWSSTVDSLTDYYVKRIDNRTREARVVHEKKTAYAQQQAAIRHAWNQHLPPPNVAVPAQAAQAQGAN